MWNRCIQFHGHTCKGLAIGYRVGIIALDKLASRRAIDEEIIAIVENASCAVDAISVTTGATLGKGNLLLQDYGKQVYTFGLRTENKAIRIAVRNLSWPKDVGIENILSMDEELFAKVEEVELKLPPKARMHRSYPCSFCDESVSEAKLRIRDGKLCCIPCAYEDLKRW
ncbi:MAG: FmdE family protein [Limnochordia bacterium]|jgi:formylmethanofuran dehydrogenase subunit E|nr:FmdE family protein [Limnochordia bacterium]MDD2628838.1 FmdE family protein [Limnochordia bacterium]MDD4517433.1 FmdE family protein [Limnochordia bacterium]